MPREMVTDTASVLRHMLASMMKRRWLPGRASRCPLRTWVSPLVRFWLKPRNAEDSAELSLKFTFAASLVQQRSEGQQDEERRDDSTAQAAIRQCCKQQSEQNASRGDSTGKGRGKRPPHKPEHYTAALPIGIHRNFCCSRKCNRYTAQKEFGRSPVLRISQPTGTTSLLEPLLNLVRRNRRGCVNMHVLE